ncbi:MAG: tetratricopeptide repeat protein [Anaerolineae bacterium]
MDDFEARVTAGNDLERAGQDDAAIEHFRLFVADYPDEPRAHFEYGGAFDSAGREAEAIPHYKKAMEMGLSGEFLPKAYLQLGSSLRNIGAHDEAIATLEEGCQHFPDFHALKVFKALAQESAGQSQDALTTLFELVIKGIQTPDMQRYARAIRYYVDERKP